MLAWHGPHHNDSAIDEGCEHLRACVQTNYGHLSSCCDSVNMGHEIFHIFRDFKLYLL